MDSRVRRSASVLVAAILPLLAGPTSSAHAADQPLAVFHAFDQAFADVEGFVCELARQGYSHVQLAPAQKSNPSQEWWARYQPVDYGVIEGKGSDADLRSLVSTAHSCGVKVVADVVFNHMADVPGFHDLDPYADRTDALLATTYVLAREGGTPLVLNWDNHDFAPVRAGVRFRQIMRQRGASGALVKENVLAVVDSPTVLVKERGNEGFYVVNKAAEKLDVPVLDLTLTNLEGCYRELRNDFNVAIERRGDKKFVTRWGTWSRGGLAVEGRDALYFVREPWSQCQLR